MAKYFIGTAGWSYADWSPVFYPGQRGGDFDHLHFYAGFFNTVEVNSTYYKYLTPAMAQGWIEKTADKEDFAFTVKLHQDFTHKRQFNDRNIESVKRLLDVLAVKGRLGALLLQFPYSFSLNSAAIAYVRKLSEIFEAYNRVLEVRHDSWQGSTAVDFCRSLNMTLAAVDQPQIGAAIPFEPVASNKRAYIRFHGRNIDAWRNSIRRFGEKQSYDERSSRYKYLYSPAELIDVVKAVKEIQKQVEEIYVIMNNHPTGYAVANALEMKYYLEELDKVKMPDTIANTFQRLKKIGDIKIVSSEPTLF